MQTFISFLIICPFLVSMFTDEDLVLFQLDDYISSADVSDTNRHFAQCYRDGLVHRDFDIVPAQVLSYDNKTLHNVYSIQHGSESTPV